MSSEVSGAVPGFAGRAKIGEPVARPQTGEDSGRREEAAHSDPPITPATLQREVSRLNEYVREARRDLAFRVDEGSGRVVITVTNPVTEEVIRQIPPQRLLELAERFEQGGLFVEDSA